MWVEKNGPVYRIRDLVHGKKVTIETGWPNKTAAKERLIVLKAEQLRGDWVDPRAGKLLLGDWIATWWPVYKASLKPNTVQSEGSRIRTHILPRLGHLALDELDTLVLQTWVAAMLTGEKDPDRPDKWKHRPIAVKTVRNCHGLLHKILAAAVQQRRLRANPCDGVQLPKLVPREMRFLTEPEAGRLVAAVPKHWRPLVLLLIMTGLRWGEAIGLAVKNLDVLTGRLTVVRSMSELATGELVFGTPKTHRGRRTVTFPAKTVGAALAGLVVDKHRDDVVFTAPNGGPVRTRNFRRGWVKWTEKAGLPGLRIHDLRHTQAAWLISANKPLSAISRRLGHASIAVTDGLYGHLLPEVEEGILAVLEAALTHIDPALLDIDDSVDLALTDAAAGDDTADAGDEVYLTADELEAAIEAELTDDE
ncbi:tyrosine-type recombinase/integrase [Micromonospora thermarum]|uniref:Site-specific integrase n=1 Tax=Micromonospora thermarum TaxID=2720024 RepID=A0ABX0ZCM5_9ACTN|nr:site-specific integrase [Micromonospora thermarum]NJP33728.1 site-specific integrase [Micromonospora thermarum]